VDLEAVDARHVDQSRHGGNHVRIGLDKEVREGGAEKGPVNICQQRKHT
jgi:hypothetical protein